MEIALTYKHINRGAEGAPLFYKAICLLIYQSTSCT